MVGYGRILSKQRRFSASTMRTHTDTYLLASVSTSPADDCLAASACKQEEVIRSIDN